MPGLANTALKRSSVSSAGEDLNWPPALVTTCGSSSWLVQVTVAPAGTTSCTGWKWKLRMPTVYAADAGMAACEDNTINDIASTEKNRRMKVLLTKGWKGFKRACAR